MNTHLLLEEEKTYSDLEKTTISEIPVPLNLFSDCLLETTGQQRRRRGWSVVFSISFQAVILGILVLMPLMFTEVLPTKQLLTFLVAPPPPPPPPPPAAVATRPASFSTDLVQGQLLTPTAIPLKIKMVHEEEVQPSGSVGVPGGVQGGVPNGQLGGVLGSLLGATAPAPNVAQLAKRVRVSQGVSEGMLLQKVVPEYPPLARTARVQGVVELAAVISKNGTIENLHVVSGHPMLVASAIAAVKQWRYRPYLLNGQPVEIETNIIVTFTFQSS